jgi:segregation and condensation protein B
MTETTATETETTPTEPERPREARAEKIRTGLEALLFSSPRPIPEKDLADVLEATREAVTEALALLAADADRPDRGVRLEKVAGGWRFVTRPEHDSLLRRYHEVSERSRLSLAALETLAIIAYRQPITLPEIQEIRGVNSSSVLKTLFEKKLVTTAGKKSVVGTPFLYRTTPDFLVRFGLNELEELPRPEEIEEDLAATMPEDAPPETRVPTAADFRPSHSDDEERAGDPAALAPAAGPDDDEDEDEDDEDADEAEDDLGDAEPSDEDLLEEDDLDEDDDDDEDDEDDEEEDDEETVPPGKK